MLQFVFNMAIMRGSRSRVDGSERPRLTDDDILEMITTQVTKVVREAILEMFGSIKTVMIEIFDERYGAVTEAAIVVTTAVVATTELQG